MVASGWESALKRWIKAAAGEGERKRERNIEREGERERRRLKERVSKWSQ